jgi:hypothetical protein
MRHVLERLPQAESVGDFEALLPWKGRHHGSNIDHLSVDELVTLNHHIIERLKMLKMLKMPKMPKMPKMLESLEAHSRWCISIQVPGQLRLTPQRAPVPHRHEVQPQNRDSGNR